MANRKQNNIRINPSDQTCYGYYNLGWLIGVCRLKRQAKKEAEKWTGKQWSEISDYIEIHKVVVSKA